MGLFGKGGIFGGGLLGGGLFGGGGGSLGKFIISESTIPSIDLPERVKERNRESSNPLVQTVQAIDDAREEAKEIMTDGVVEMVFKGNEDYQTSFEKREKADRIIQQERSKYNRACEQVNQEIAALNAHGSCCKGFGQNSLCKARALAGYFRTIFPHRRCNSKAS